MKEFILDRVEQRFKNYVEFVSASFNANGDGRRKD